MADLQQQIGCSRQQLTKWLATVDPPKRVTKGFDRTLCRALQTTREMLFNRYATTPPEAAPLVVSSPDQLFPDEGGRVLHAYPQTQVLAELAEVMKPSEVSQLIEHAALLILAKNDERRPHVETLLVNRAKGDLLDKSRRGEIKVAAGGKVLDLNVSRRDEPIEEIVMEVDREKGLRHFVNTGTGERWTMKSKSARRSS